MLGMNTGLFRKLAVDDRVWTASELAKDLRVDLRLLGKHLSSKLQTFEGTNYIYLQHRTPSSLPCSKWYHRRDDCGTIPSQANNHDACR